MIVNQVVYLRPGGIVIEAHAWLWQVNREQDGVDQRQPIHPKRGQDEQETPPAPPQGVEGEGQGREEQGRAGRGAWVRPLRTAPARQTRPPAGGHKERAIGERLKIVHARFAAHVAVRDVIVNDGEFLPIIDQDELPAAAGGKERLVVDQMPVKYLIVSPGMIDGQAIHKQDGADFRHPMPFPTPQAAHGRTRRPICGMESSSSG